MTGVPNAPPYPVPYSAHTDIQMRELYQRVQRIERTVTIIDGESVAVDHGTVKLLPVRPVRVAAVNVPYHRGWWIGRRDPILIANLTAPAVVLNIAGSIKDKLVPDFWPTGPPGTAGRTDELAISVSGLLPGRDPGAHVRPIFAVKEYAYTSQGSPGTDRGSTGMPIQFVIDNRHDKEDLIADPADRSGLPRAYQHVRRVLRTSVDLYVGMYSTRSNGAPDASDIRSEFNWDPDQKGTIDVVVTYIDSGFEKERVETRPTNQLADKVLLIQGEPWGPTP